MTLIILPMFGMIIAYSILLDNFEYILAKLGHLIDNLGYLIDNLTFNSKLGYLIDKPKHLIDNIHSLYPLCYPIPNTYNRFSFFKQRLIHSTACVAYETLVFIDRYNSPTYIITNANNFHLL